MAKKRQSPSTSLSVRLAEKKRKKNKSEHSGLSPLVQQLLTTANQEIQQNQFAQAQRTLDHILSRDAKNAYALQLKGVLAYRQSKLNDAIHYFRMSLKIDPGQSQIWFQLGILYDQAGSDELCWHAYEKCLKLAPEHFQALNNLGTLAMQRGHLCLASKLLQKAHAIEPAETQVLVNLANTLSELGDHAAAMENYRKAIADAEDFFAAHSNYLLSLHYDYLLDAEAIAVEHRTYGRTLEERVPKLFSPDSRRNEKITIAYLSPDFRAHAVNNFFEPLLAHHDRSCFQVICYSNTRQPDDVTRRLVELADHWRDVNELSDREIAQMIYSDQVDILVDMAGHTAGDRLQVFAMKPAPVQVTWLGYPDTTGLSRIDYRFCDKFTDPEPSADRRYSEKLVRLPGGFLCYQGNPTLPEIDTLPASRNGHIIFGSFNNLLKTNDSVIATWSHILQATPDSRLLLKAKHFADPDFCRTMRARFKNHGISPERLILKPAVRTHSEHMLCYQEVDIALDTFPYNGTTTVFEALWMGVPTLTLVGTTHVERVAGSILNRLGLQDWLTFTMDDYIERASTLASELDTLQSLRTSLRQRLRNSELTDAKRFARNVEQAYSNMIS